MVSRLKTLLVLAVAVTGLLLLHTLSARNAYTPASASHFGGFPACNDGIDNDHDGHVDYPRDPECNSIDDNSEAAAADGMFLEITDNESSVEAGKNLTYSVLVTSFRHETRSVDIRVQLPHPVNNVLDVRNGGYRDGATVVWTNVVLEPNRERRLYFTVHVDPDAKDGDVLVTRVTSAGISDVDSTTIKSDKKDAPRKRNRIRLTVTDDKEFAMPTEELTYRIVVENKDHYTIETDVHATVPGELNLRAVSGDHDKDGRKLVWRDIELRPGERRQFLVSGFVERDTAEYYTLRMRVSAGNASATDHTTLGGEALANSAIHVQVSDQQKSARPGDVITYDVVVTNTSGLPVSQVDVRTALPNRTDFVDSTDGGYWDGTHILWKNLTVSPASERHLQYTVRVRPDNYGGDTIRTSVIAGNSEGVDITELADRSPARRYQPARVHNQPAHRRGEVLYKQADRQEVTPGQMVTYTVTLQNTSNAPYENVRVLDSFEGTHFRLVNADGASVNGNNLVWTVPYLAPGQTWQTSYQLQVAGSTPHGTYLHNRVSADGRGLNTLSYTERIHTSKIGVVTHLPQTGAPVATAGVSLTAFLSLAGAAMQRRLFV